VKRYAENGKIKEAQVANFLWNKRIPNLNEATYKLDIEGLHDELGKASKTIKCSISDDVIDKLEKVRKNYCTIKM